MDITRVLLDILIVLAAAKLAAEGAERLGMPAVVGEILAGIIIGPSALGIVGTGDEVLRALGEIGVILLLLDVGLQMDVGELRQTGRSSLQVAVVGVIAPMALGYLAMKGLGGSNNTALFMGGALTATSVGITARVFGDLRALASSEARIVLGAAVADDVIGLVVLTVVVRIVTGGSVSALSVAGIVALAVAFLVIGAMVGLRVAPILFSAIDRRARSTGTIVALAVVFTLGFAELAHAAKLAPIVGAFVAGLALSRADQSERIRSELTPVGHLFIPVFFLQIGIDAKLDAFGKPAVLRDAAILIAVAVVGKLVSMVGARGAPGDKLLVGLGMLPRGEVGLIFATLGLQSGVLGADLYASLLLVVLVTTLVTPQLLKMRHRRLRPASGRVASAAEPPPGRKWIEAIDGEIVLVAVPPDDIALPLALEAALAARHAVPSGELMDWFDGLPNEVDPTWDARSRDLLVDVIERGGARSWRFLHGTGIIDRTLPELATAIRSRRSDAFQLDPDAGYRWRTLERLRVLDAGDPAIQEARQLAHPDRLLLAAFLGTAFDAEPDAVSAATAFLRRIGATDDERDEVVALVTDRHLLWAAAKRSHGLQQEAVLQLAAHLGSIERVRALYAISALQDGHERWERKRLDELHRLIMESLSPDTEVSLTIGEQHRAEAAALVTDDDAAVERVRTAPLAFVARTPPAELAARLRLIDPLPARHHLHIDVRPQGTSRWGVEVVAHDRPGLLAATAGALANAGLDIERAAVVTWPDGAALESYVVRGGVIHVDALREAAEAALGAPLRGRALEHIELHFDNRASPWHTVCEVSGPEKHGLLQDLAAVFGAVGVTVLAATIGSHAGRAIDWFEVTDVNGRKLSTDLEQRISELASQGFVEERSRFGRRRLTSPDPAAKGGIGDAPVTASSPEPDPDVLMSVHGADTSPKRAASTVLPSKVITERADPTR